jgi:menaquinone-9 beta-reductase
MRAWDVAVVGGGPAGCSAAISLARRGLKVVLYEARTYPHDKLCGEFLSPECAPVLGALGLQDRLAALNPVSIHSARITAPDGTVWETRLPGLALGLSRKTLDAALAEEAQRAGVSLCQAASVTGVAGSLVDGFELEVSGSQSNATVYTRSVLAAHGKRSPFDRLLGRHFLAKHQPYVALKAHFHGPPVPNRIELHTFPGGYCGMSEIEGGAQVVCLLVHEKVFQQRRGLGADGVDGFITWMMGQNGYLRSWLQNAERIHPRWISTAQVPFGRKTALERDILMSGDAAGLIAPLAGNGIAMALESGRLAAGWLDRYLAGQIRVEELRQGYPAEWQQRFGLRLRLGRAIQPVLLRPRLASTALRLMNAFPPAGQFLVERTRGPA